MRRLGRAGRWLASAALTAVGFALCLLGTKALLAPRWAQHEADQWVIAVGLATAVAAVLGLWAASWAGSAPPETGGPDTGNGIVSGTVGVLFGSGVEAKLKDVTVNIYGEP